MTAEDWIKDKLGKIELLQDDKEIINLMEQFANEKVKEFAKEVSTKLVDCEDDEEFTKWINTKF